MLAGLFSRYVNEIAISRADAARAVDEEPIDPNDVYTTLHGKSGPVKPDEGGWMQDLGYKPVNVNQTKDTSVDF